MFKLIKEIKSKTGVTHFKRWEIIKTPFFSIWLHGIYKKDEDSHLHNHPWDFISIILKGSYIEQTENGFNEMSFGKVNIRSGSKFHKIYKLKTPSIYTLFFATKVKREWGYNLDGKFVNNITYRNLKNGLRFTMINQIDTTKPMKGRKCCGNCLFLKTEENKQPFCNHHKDKAFITDIDSNFCGDEFWINKRRLDNLEKLGI